VSWYEAEAYCNWLTARWRDEGTITADEQVRLPTRAEWEQAARLGAEAPKDAASDYPWRGAFATWRANTEESGLQQNTPVTMYPDGRTAGGVWDMSGNVWEWTCDPHKEFADAYLQKGGAYWQGADGARASAVDRDLTRFRNGSRGCRVVVVPISRSG
jgi:formylglycine-generating enzyme required for sulfatase activity